MRCTHPRVSDTHKVASVVYRGSASAHPHEWPSPHNCYSEMRDPPCSQGLGAAWGTSGWFVGEVGMSTTMKKGGFHTSYSSLHQLVRTCSLHDLT